MRYLVTGGAGFIGSHLVEKLIAEGAQVRVLDNFSTGLAENIAAFRQEIEVIEGDIRDPNAVRAAVKGSEVVFHLAALGSVPRSVADPLTTHETNATGTLSLLWAAKEEGVQRFVYSSSSSVYGDSPTLPKKEDMMTQPKSPYGVSKEGGEHYCRAFWESYRLPTVSLRYFNVFGPRQRPDGPYAAVVPRFVDSCLRGLPSQVFGDGLQTRDFTYVANAVEATWLAASAQETALGKPFNIATGNRVSLRYLLQLVSTLTGNDPTPMFLEPREGDIRDSLASIDAAREFLDYHPSVSLGAGLERTVSWYAEKLRNEAGA